MLKNATYLFPENYWNLSHFVSDLRGQPESSGVPYAMTLSAAIFVALLSPVALAGNVLVLAAIWRNPSLRTPSYLLLPGLAFTDFSTGLITQPVYVAAKLVRMKTLEGGKDLNIVMGAVTNGCAVLFTSTSLLMITLMSIERWLHMTRRSLVTERRSYIMFAVMLLLISNKSATNRQQQIQAHELSHNFGQPSIDFAKYKRSVISGSSIL